MSVITKLNFKKEKNDSTLELLECGHQNNLKLAGRKTAECPKGDTKTDKGEIIRP